jgi:benzodiazapine receptor
MRSATSPDYSTPVSLAALAVFIALVLGGGGLISSFSVPGPWYANLVKPPFNPPGWAFAPVWSAIYAMIALAGWRIWVAAPHSAAMRFWSGQMVLNWAWPPVFFVAHRPWPAFGVLIAMLFAITGFILTARKHDRLAPILFLPYLAWVCFAGYLNLSFALLN